MRTRLWVDSIIEYAYCYVDDKQPLIITVLSALHETYEIDCF